MFDGSLLDDDALRGRIVDDGGLDDDETFGGGILEDGDDWEENQAQQMAEFERLRQKELSDQHAPERHQPPSSQRRGFVIEDVLNDRSNIFNLPQSTQSSSRSVSSGLQPPSFFQVDEDERSRDISASLNRLLSEDDPEDKGSWQSGSVMDGRPGVTAVSNKLPWSTGMHYVAPKTFSVTAISATANSLATIDLSRDSASADQHATPAAGSSISAQNLFSRAVEQSPSPAPAATAQNGQIDLLKLLPKETTNGAGHSVPLVAMPPSRGMRLEDLESNLRTESSKLSGTMPHAARPAGDLNGAAGQATDSWTQQMSVLQAGGARPEVPAIAGQSNMAAPLPRPPLLPPGPRPHGHVPPPGGPIMPGHPDMRPGFPRGPPPNMPAMHPVMRGMPPQQWGLYGRPPPPGQRMHDMPMLRFPHMPGGMRPPVGDPTWRGHPPNMRPHFLPVVPGLPPPGAARMGPMPPTNALMVAAGGHQPQGHAQPRHKNVMDYPFVFMTNREKEWILKLQLIQLSRYSSWMDDYYYVCHKKKYGTSTHNLTLPPLGPDIEIKPEGIHGRVTIFENALGGRIAAGSVLCPRQSVMIDAPINLNSASGPVEITMHRRREHLYAIERAYDAVLGVSDMERGEGVDDKEWRLTRQRVVVAVFKRVKIRSLRERVEDHKSSSLDEHSVSFLSINKGARVVARLVPLLSISDVQSLAGLVCHHLSAFLKRDKERSALKTLLAAFVEEVQRWSLNVLVCLLEFLVSQAVAQNKVAPIALLIEYYASSAVPFLSCLLQCGYRQCQSKDTNPIKTRWQQSCLRLHRLLEPHRAGLLRVVKNEAAYLAFLEVLANCAAGKFEA